VDNRLLLLYKLQLIDSELFEIQELKGDLPGIVAELEERVGGMKRRLKELNDAVKQARIQRDAADVENVELGGKVEKYKKQQLQVKSNKQYDALTREIEAAEERTRKLTKEMEVLEGRMELAKKDAEELSTQFEALSEELQGQQKELREVNKQHEKEELKFQHDREKVVVRLEKQEIDRYERIRKAKGGKAVVLVTRGACGGCFKRVPPQKILELRRDANMYQCEHCGRIIISDTLVKGTPA
jgi:predicted  nucleic acid-binding Zn-ribbon protein